jgi:hypothetical protein
MVARPSCVTLRTAGSIWLAASPPITSANVLPMIERSSKPKRSAYALFANWHCRSLAR